MAYGDGKLVMKGGAQLLSEGLFAFPETANQTQSYTMQMVMETIDESPAMLAYTKPSGAWTADGVRYTAEAKYHDYGVKMFGARYKTFLQDIDTHKLQLAWYASYGAALADEGLRDAWQGGDHILEAHYNALVALETADGVEVGTYAYTDAEIRYATWAGFQKLISGDMDTATDPVSTYYVKNTEAPKSAPSGVTATVIHAGNPFWIADADGQANSKSIIFAGRDYGTVFTRSDVAVITKNEGDAYWTWSNSRYLDGEQAKSVFEKANFKANDLHFSWYDIPAAFYAIRLYGEALNESEMAQNNFADLCNYYGIEKLDLYEALNSDEKAELYEEFKSVRIGSTDKETLDAAIEGAYAKRFEKAKAFARDYLTFDGYQMTLYEGVAFRAAFTLHSERSYADLTILEVGVLSTIADGETALDDLTVSKGENGYESEANLTLLYDGSAFANTTELEDGTTVYRATVSFDENTLTRDKLTEEHIFRGYVAYEFLGEEFLVYTDMSSTVFADGAVSMNDLASLDALAAYPVSQKVQAIVGAE